MLKLKINIHRGDEKLIYDIQVLKGSGYEVLKKLGHLLDDREDQDGGLNKEEVYELLKIVNESSIDNIHRKAFENGMHEVLCQ